MTATSGCLARLPPKIPEAPFEPLPAPSSGWLLGGWWGVCGGDHRLSWPSFSQSSHEGIPKHFEHLMREERYRSEKSDMRGERGGKKGELWYGENPVSIRYS